MAFGDAGTRRIVSGAGECLVTLAVAAFVGDPLAYSSGWTPADANASKPALLIAGEDGGVGAVIKAYVIAVVEGFTGGTAGNLLYLSDTVNKYSDSASTTSKQVCGQMLTPTCAYIAPERFGQVFFQVSHKFAAAGVTDCFFIAPFRCTVTKIQESHGTAAGETCTIEVERLQGTEAPGGGNGDALLNSTKIDGNGTANTVQTPTLTGTAASLILEVGNRLGMTLATGAAGALANATITVEFVKA